MTLNKTSPLSKTCPQCGQSNRASFHCCHHCGYVFSQPDKKWHLSRRQIGTLIGAILGLCVGLLWSELRFFTAIIGLFGGAYFASILSFGPKADVRVAVIGFFVGGMLGVLRIVFQGTITHFAYEITLMAITAIISSYTWKGMYIGDRNIRIGGMIGAVAGIIFGLISPTIRDNANIGMNFITVVIFATSSTLAGTGVVYEPWLILLFGLFSGISNWLGLFHSPTHLTELPQVIFRELYIMAFICGFRQVSGDKMLG